MKKNKNKKNKNKNKKKKIKNKKEKNKKNKNKNKNKTKTKNKKHETSAEEELQARIRAQHKQRGCTKKVAGGNRQKTRKQPPDHACRHGGVHAPARSAQHGAPATQARPCHGPWREKAA